MVDLVDLPSDEVPLHWEGSATNAMCQTGRENTKNMPIICDDMFNICFKYAKYMHKIGLNKGLSKHNEVGSNSVTKVREKN